MNVVHGDCLEVMAGMEPESVDAVVTDPPYGLEFMGKGWDKLDGIGEVSTWGTWPGQRGRATRMPSANANVRCRTCNGWKVGRATNASKCRCDRPNFPDLGQSSGPAMQAWHARWAEAAYRVAKPSAYLLAFGGTRTVHRMAVAIEDAGWIIRDMLVWAYASGFPKSKASLKPAWEPIVMARKPGPLRMLAIDECRIAAEPYSYPNGPKGNVDPTSYNYGRIETPVDSHPAGRWPANLILTDPIFDGDVDGVVGGGVSDSLGGFVGNAMSGAWEGGPVDAGAARFYGDAGTYSRFFLIPKADRGDREPVLGGPTKVRAILGQGIGGADNLGVARANHHPTVKPTELMRHLVRLVTPAGGTVLDPFLGSGTTGIACELEGFPWIGVEKELEYVQIAEARLNGTQRGMGLSA